MPLLARRYPEIFQVIVCLFMMLFASQYDSVFWLALQTLTGLYVMILGYSLWRENFSLKGPFPREVLMGYEGPKQGPIPEEAEQQPPPEEDILKEFETEVKKHAEKDSE